MRKPLRVVPLLVAGLAVMPSAAPAPAEDAGIVHLLNRISYGPRPSDLERVRQRGIQGYIEVSTIRRRSCRPGRACRSGPGAATASRGAAP